MIFETITAILALKVFELIDGGQSGDSEEQSSEDLRKSWHLLHRQLYGSEGDLSDSKTMDEIEKEMGEMAAAVRKALVDEWQRLHRELYGSEVELGDAKTCTDIKKEIDEFLKRKPLIEEWKRLHRKRYGSEGHLNDSKTCADLQEEINLLERHEKIDSLTHEWKRLHEELYGNEGLCHAHASEEIQREIDEFLARKPLIEEWKRLQRELYGAEARLHGRWSSEEDARWDYPWHFLDESETREAIQDGINGLLMWKPRFVEWKRLYGELFGSEGFLDERWCIFGEEEIQRESLALESALPLKKQWDGDKNLIIDGVIADRVEWWNELGIHCRGMLVDIDNGGRGILPLGALDRGVQNNVRREFQRMTGHSIRNFEEAYPLYHGKRIRAKIARPSPRWLPTGILTAFELTDGVVEGYEGRGTRRVAASGTAGGPEAGTERHVGDVVEGHVQSTTGYGVFVDFEDGAVGLIHLTKMGLGFVENVSAVFPQGEVLKAEIIGIAEGNGRTQVELRLLDFPDKMPLAAGRGTHLPMLLIDGPGLWRSLGGWRGEGLALLLAACRKAHRRAVLVADSALEGEMERAGDAAGLALLRDLREKHRSEVFVCSPGADGVASAMRRRACLLECRIVGNDAALAEAVGVAACAVVADADGLSVPELGLRCKSATADGKASASATAKILVDGVNCIGAKLGGKGLATVLDALKAGGRIPFTFFDDSILGKPDKDLQNLIRRLMAAGEACVVPSGSDMDDYLLPMADSCGLDIVTNKRFHGKEGKYPWVSKRVEEGKRLHPFSLIDGMLLIPSLSICVPLENRSQENPPEGNE